MNQQNDHIWKFSNIGGVSRVRLESGQDLLHLDGLDQKLWTALSCPVHGLEIDVETLKLIDSDNDGRIRVPEILSAVKWICSLLNDPDTLLKGKNHLPLAVISTETQEGKKLLNSARQILSNLNRSKQDSISIEETSNSIKIFEKTKFNGDGIITTNSTDDGAIKQLITQMMTCVGSVLDKSGDNGLSQELIDLFYLSCEEYACWLSKKPVDGQTEESFQSFLTVKSKIDDYFFRCRLSAYAPQSLETLNISPEKFERFNLVDLPINAGELASYPLAKIEAGHPLNLCEGINPAWEEKIELFKSLVLKASYDQLILTESDWQKISQKFKAYSLWKSEKKGQNVEPLGSETILQIIAENQKNVLETLVKQDKAFEDEASNIFLVDKMVRYHRDIYTLCKNFITFSDFYSLEKKAIFQAGTLYFDQRSFDLCIKVDNMLKHSSMANQSGMYLIYCDCISKIKNEKMTVVVAITNGDVDNLMVGRNALFYDRSGLDWDATITKIMDNPISISQAFWSPYRKIIRFIEAQINKFASAKDAQVQNDLTTKIEQAPEKIKDQPNPSPVPFDIGKFVGIFAAIGLALGAIGTALASLVAGFLGLVWWKMPLAFLGMVMIVSGPSMIIAWLKLRKRNLAPLLDANGWAINAKATVNIPFGNMLTHIANLPKNAKHDLADPFAKRMHKPWLVFLIVGIAFGVSIYLLWHFDKLKF